MLPRLLPLEGAALGDESPAGRWQVVRLLMRALRRTRRDARAGHWTYDINRHLALRRALDAELMALATLQPAMRPTFRRLREAVCPPSARAAASAPAVSPRHRPAQRPKSVHFSPAQFSPAHSSRHRASPPRPRPQNQTGTLPGT